MSVGVAVKKKAEKKSVKSPDQMGKTDELTEAQRKEIRCQLHSDVEAFLSGGGEVQRIADNVRADPPRKPTINYGSSPI